MKKTLVAYPIGSTPQFRVVSVSKHSVSVKFDDGEPDEIGIRFDSRGPDDTTADKPKVLVRNMTAWAAVDYIIEESESGQKWHPANKEFFGCKAFSDAAEEGKLAVEGRPKYHADTADIPHTYWRVGQLNPVAYLDYAVGKHNRSDGGESEQSRSDVVPSTFTEYVGLRVNEDEVKKIWPKVNT